MYIANSRRSVAATFYFVEFIFLKRTFLQKVKQVLGHFKNRRLNNVRQ